MNIIDAIQNKNYADLRTYFRERYLEKLANRIVQEKDKFLEQLKK